MSLPRVPRPLKLATIALLIAPSGLAQDAGARPRVTPSPAEVRPATEGARRYAGQPEEAILEGLRRGAILRAEPVGHTALNYHVRLAGGREGAFKPAEGHHRTHYLAEVAAFEVSRLLGLERVPPAVLRRVPLSALPDAEAVGVISEGGFVRGAMIHWVPVLRHVGLNTPNAVLRWSRQLTIGGELPPEERARAEELSSLLVFDYLIGNWDRWRGTNTLVDGAGRLVYRDNNGGFYVPFEERRHEEVLSWLERTEKFSRSLIDRARALTLEALRAAMTSPAHGQFLSDAQLRGVLYRRDALLSYVAALVALHGEAAVYAFP